MEGKPSGRGRSKRSFFFGVLSFAISVLVAIGLFVLYSRHSTSETNDIEENLRGALGLAGRLAGYINEGYYESMLNLIPQSDTPLLGLFFSRVLALPPGRILIADSVENLKFTLEQIGKKKLLSQELSKLFPKGQNLRPSDSMRVSQDTFIVQFSAASGVNFCLMERITNSGWHLDLPASLVLKYPDISKYLVSSCDSLLKDLKDEKSRSIARKILANVESLKKEYLLWLAPNARRNLDRNTIDSLHAALEDFWRLDYLNALSVSTVLEGDGSTRSSDFTIESKGVVAFEVSIEKNGHFTGILMPEDTLVAEQVLPEIRSQGSSSIAFLLDRGRYSIDVRASGKWSVIVFQPDLNWAPKVPLSSEGNGTRIAGFFRAPSGTLKIILLGNNPPPRAIRIVGWNGTYSPSFTFRDFGKKKEVTFKLEEWSFLAVCVEADANAPWSFRIDKSE